ncbi:MAG TPA: ester cyclase [Micromonosporaceae bacterium]
MTDPLALFRQLIDRGFTAADETVIDRIVSPEFLEHQFVPPGRPPRMTGADGVKALVRELHRGATDFRLTIEAAVVHDGTVWARLTGTGIDTGGQLGRAPTGRPFAVTVIDIIRFAAGQAVEHWAYPTGSHFWNSSATSPTPAAGVDRPHRVSAETPSQTSRERRDDGDECPGARRRGVADVGSCGTREIAYRLSVLLLMSPPAPGRIVPVWT